MSTETISTANYAAVIADLRAKRAELDRTISMLEAMANLPQSSQSVTLTHARTSDVFTGPIIGTTSMPDHVGSGTGSNNGIGEAVANILKAHPGRALSTREVTDLLLQSGFPQQTENPINNVWSALSHRSKVKKDVIREGKNWRFARIEKSASTLTGGNYTITAA
jgi:hypothetical protein